MQGYDEEAAAAYIVPRVKRDMGAGFALDVERLVREAIAQDLAYMRASGVIGEDGYAGEGEYDEDDAFEYILDALCASMGLDEDEEMLAAQALDAFTVHQGDYMEKAGLCAW